MKTLELNEMEEVQGGGWFSDACWAFGSVAAIWEVGALLNAWNPIGQAALVGFVVIGAACVIA